MSLRRLAYARLLLLAVCTACGNDEVTPRSEVVVSVDSDLAVGSQLSRVEVRLLELAGSMEMQQREFVLSDGGGEGVQLPFTFTITQGKQDRFRLEVTGYGPKSASGEESSVEYEVIGQFRYQKRLALHVLLAEACLDRRCVGDKTCYPLTTNGTAAGECGPIPEETRLPLHPAAAPAWPDASLEADGADAGAEDAGDGMRCPEGESCQARCSDASSVNCKEEPGAACEDGSTCKSGHCVDGVCCRSECDGDCRACNLAGHEGTCSELDYASDANNCGQCGAVCSDQNVLEPMCVAGTCGGECAPGYLSCIDGNDGCETYVMDNPERCGSCGNACTYPYCFEGECAAIWGPTSMYGVLNVQPNQLIGYRMQVGRPGTLVALGLLTSLPISGDPKPQIKLGLYQDLDGYPDARIAHSSVIDVVDTRVEGERLIGTEAVVPPVPLAAGVYWVLFKSSAALDVYVEDVSVDAFRTLNVAFEEEMKEYPEFGDTDFPTTNDVDAYLLIAPGA
jgi:hypothetical protein